MVGQVIVTGIVHGQYAVRVMRNESGTYSVEYGKQTKSELTSIDAAQEFLNCMAHSMECGGLTDD